MRLYYDIQESSIISSSLSLSLTLFLVCEWRQIQSLEKLESGIPIREKGRRKSSRSIPIPARSKSNFFLGSERERERRRATEWGGVDGGPGHIHTQREKEETVIEKVWAPSSNCSNTIFSQEKFFQGAQKIVGEAQHFPC